MDMSSHGAGCVRTAGAQFGGPTNKTLLNARRAILVSPIWSPVRFDSGAAHIKKVQRVRTLVNGRSANIKKVQRGLRHQGRKSHSAKKMEQITKEKLQAKLNLLVDLEILPRVKGHRWVLDHHQPGGNPYVWSLVLRDEKTGSGYQPINERFKPGEMNALLRGLQLSYELAEKYR